MNAYDFVQLSLLAMDGEIRGKTRLQKTVYFLGVLSGHADELGYHPHFYGPYSDAVADGVDRLRGLGFVDQSIVGGGAGGCSGFEMARYDFRLNEQGRRVAEMKKRHLGEEWQKIKRAADALKAAGEIDYVGLSIAAKTHFMLGESRGRATIADLALLARRFGWSVTEDQLRGSAEYLERLGLVKL